jgi:probable F420-dependent oxidoreductase
MGPAAGRPLLGVNVKQSALPGADPVADARHAEELGFDFVSCSDHLAGTHPSFETWTMLAWVAARTSRVRIVTDVLGLPYRHPAVLAKMAETFDRLSGGRLVLGIGGGGSDDEFRAFGLEVREPRGKVDAMEEAIRILRGLWTERSFTFHGRHFHTEAAEMEPKPDRAIPVWTGSYGDRSLAVTGRLADGWIPSFRFAPPDRARGMIDRIRRAAEEAGRDPRELTYAYNVGIRVDERTDPRPYVVSGPPDRCSEQLRAFLAIGFTALNLWPAGPDPARQRERLAEQVAPLLR